MRVEELKCRLRKTSQKEIKEQKLRGLLVVVFFHLPL